MAKTKSGCGVDIRKIIIEAAKELISSQGVDKTTLAEIAKKADIEIPAIINGLFDKEIVQQSIVEKDGIKKEILSFL